MIQNISEPLSSTHDNLIRGDQKTSWYLLFSSIPDWSADFQMILSTTNETRTRPKS